MVIYSLQSFVLCAAQGLSRFLADVWEKQPKLYKAQPDRKKLFPELSSLKALKALLKDEGALSLSLRAQTPIPNGMHDSG